MSNPAETHGWRVLYPDGICKPTDLIKSVLDREIVRLPERPVSDHETRYPTNAPSMRAFLETFFTRHLFQLQNSLVDYIASPDFDSIMQSGLLRILDVGAGPAVASIGLVDMLDRMRTIIPSDGPAVEIHSTSLTF